MTHMLRAGCFTAIALVMAAAPAAHAEAQSVAPDVAQPEPNPAAPNAPATDAPVAVAPTANAPAADELPADVIVTAQKREQSINSVGLTIQAVSGEDLLNRGIRSADDLVRVVPGLTFTPSPYATPVYTLRGVGLYDSGLASTPSVSVYVDEVPLAFPIMTKAATLDVQRVEVLKGPQGTLFGQSSTGGAINYIAAKPTRQLTAGAYGSLSNFGETDLEAYVSGPLSDQLRARVAVRGNFGGAWQKSTSRDDELGDADLLSGRLLVDWTPSDRVKLSLNLNGHRDQSEPLAPSLIRVAPFNPALLAPGFAQSEPARDARDADWAEGFPKRDNRFYQGALRADIKLDDALTLTSISSYQHAKVDERLPQSGTPFAYQNILHFGDIKSFNQELRVAGDSGPLNWLVGASFERVRADDNLIYDQSLASNRQPIPFLPPFLDVANRLTQRSKTYALFANVEAKLSEHLTVRGGVRYTRYRNRGVGCSYEALASNELGHLFEILQFLVKGSFIPIAPGQCASLDENFDPAAAELSLKEKNLSWRFGAEYRTDSRILFYATASRGYKAGILPIVAASRTIQFEPAGQERLDAYEVGIKAPLFDRRLQLNASAFYYDYSDKQIRGTILDPVFGKLEREINVPESSVLGFELEAIVRPIRGFTATVGGTFLDSKVRKSFTAYNSDGVLIDAKGSPLPFTPRVQIVGDGEYAFGVRSGLEAFMGGGATYHSSDNSSLRNDDVPAREFRIKPYTLVDLRAGLQSTDGRWRGTLWVRNVFDVLHWDTTFRLIDAYHRYQQRPRTFGVSLRYAYN